MIEVIISAIVSAIVSRAVTRRELISVHARCDLAELWMKTIENRFNATSDETDGQ